MGILAKNPDLKPLLVFHCQGYEPSGGMGDLIGTVDSFREAMLEVVADGNSDGYSVYDTRTGLLHEGAESILAAVEAVANTKSD